MTRTWFVSRHPGALEWIKRQRHPFDLHVTHLDPALNATNLNLVTGREQDRMQLLNRICAAFEKRCWAVGHQWTVEREIIACRAKARLTIYRDSGNTRLNINILAGVKKPGRLWCVVCGIRSRP